MKANLKNKITNIRSLLKRWQNKLYTLKSKNYQPYNSQEFKEKLATVGIRPGDCVFIMHSQDKILLYSGQVIAPGLILQDILDYLGPHGTVLVLGFPINRQSISNQEKKFDVRKTPTECGILAEILRRKKGSVRSLQPVFSAIAYGQEAKFICESHHLSPYPFDEYSPYRKIIERGGKYLGIGVGFEAFVPCHMIEDYYKSSFRHQIYEEQPTEFTFIDQSGVERSHRFFIRNRATSPRSADIPGYFNALNIPYISCYTNSGVKLFSFAIQDFLDSAINLYDAKKITVWDTERWSFRIRRDFKKLLMKVKIV